MISCILSCSKKCMVHMKYFSMVLFCSYEYALELKQADGSVGSEIVLRIDLN